VETGKRCALYGHPSAATSALSDALHATIAQEVDSEISCAIFAINASSGVDERTVQLWHQFDELLMPRILVVTGFNEGLQDFDDAVLLAKRLLDDVATPFLVLHDDHGTPCALIDLEKLQIINYRNNQNTAADTEHVDLVSEFRTEYLEQLEAAGENGFASGIFFPAIPVLIDDPEFELGIDIVKKYLNSLPSFG